MFRKCIIYIEKKHKKTTRAPYQSYPRSWVSIVKCRIKMQGTIDSRLRGYDDEKKRGNNGRGNTTMTKGGKKTKTSFLPWAPFPTHHLPTDPNNPDRKAALFPVWLPQ